MYGSAKSSSGSTPSESSGMSSPVEESSSGSSAYVTESSGSSSGSSVMSSSSSSCQCGVMVFEIYLDSPEVSGEFTVENIGCGPITVLALTSTIPGTFTPAVPLEIPEGGFQVFRFESSGPEDIRGTTFTVTTDCGEPYINEWPLS